MIGQLVDESAEANSQDPHVEELSDLMLDPELPSTSSVAREAEESGKNQIIICLIKVGYVCLQVNAVFMSFLLVFKELNLTVLLVLASCHTFIVPLVVFI